MILKDKTAVLGFIISVFLFSCSSTVLAGPDWSIEGEYFEGCTCNPGCPCMFGSEPTYNKTCKISGVFHIRKGNYGTVYKALETRGQDCHHGHPRPESCQIRPHHY